MPIDPFSKTGAQQISKLANQPLAPQADPIDLSALTTPSKVNVPELPSAPMPDVSLASISGLLGDTAGQTELRGEQDTLVDDITATGDKLATKTARKAELETGAGLPDLNKQLTELNAQMRQVQSESFAATQTAENRPMALGLIRGEQAAIERQRAVRVYGLAAASEAIQGNIALANDQVARALDAEFGGLEREIENAKFRLSVNTENFNVEEKRRAEALQIALDKEKDALALKRADKEHILDVMLAAAQAGADNLTLTRIQNAKTPEDALNAAGQVLGTEFRAQMATQGLQDQLLRSQIAENQATIRKINSEVSTGNTLAAGMAGDVTSILSNNKVGATTRTSLGTILGVINAVEDLSKARPDGTFSGFYPGAGIIDTFLPDALKKKTTIENEGYLNAINLKVQQWASGATLTEAQTRLVQGMVPKKNDNDTKVKTKLTNLTNFMQQQIKGSLQSEGIVYEPVKVDLFGQNKTLAEIFK